MSLTTASVLDSIIHPKLTDSLYRVYTAVTTFQVTDQTQNQDGQIIDTWTDDPALIGVRGQLMDASTAEKRGIVLTAVSSTHVLSLNNYFPNILVTHRALVETAVNNGLSQTFNINGVKHASQANQTRVELELVKT